MFFRNLTLFRFPVPFDFSTLEDGLDACRLKPVGPLDMFSRGFVSPLGRDAKALSHGVGDGLWITLGGEDKLLPSAVVNEEVARRADDIEERDGSKLGGRARKRLKDEVLHELLPKAFTRPSRVGAHIDQGLAFVAVDTSSRKTAEGVISEMRRALGSFPAIPLNSEVAPRAILTAWLAGESMPEGLTLGDECELKDPVDRGAVVKCQRQELDAEEVGKHLEAGKLCSRLALSLDGRMSFVLGDDLVVRKLKFLDGAVDQLENSEPDSMRAELDARYALMAAELKRLFALLEASFKLSRAER